jgi:CheY-like chemotaxis protein
MEKKEILVVDDDIVTLNMLKSAIAGAGYSVLPAASGREALRISKEHSPFVIVLDIMLPDLDGGEVANFLKADPKTKDIPIIFLSSLISEKDEKTGNKKDLHSFLSKPYNREKLLNEIRQCLYRADLANPI